VTLRRWIKKKPSLELGYVSLHDSTRCVRELNCHTSYTRGCTTKGRFNSSVVKDMTTCCEFKVNRRFEGTCRLHLQGRRMSQGRNRRENRLHAGDLIATRYQTWFLPLWRWKRHYSPKYTLKLNSLRGVICRKVEIFITTAVITWNPT
jgi:hypothetical protein